MSKLNCLIITVMLTVSCIATPLKGEFRKLKTAEYMDKMKGGWVGQMAGVGWGGPTEFQYCGVIVPEEDMPQWQPEMINQFNQDDIYVEMTFLRTLELYGFDVSIRQAGIDFANSRYQLWHANFYGRQNLRRGIAPPDSGHPQFSKHTDDIDYQIEADYSGLIAPGMPNLAIELGEKFGRLMNYGDGLYGGQFVGAMYAEAFFNRDIEKIIAAGLAAIPAESQYAECVRDVVAWHRDNPDDWQKTWGLIDDKYNRNADYRRFTCPEMVGSDGNIDAKINGAYIVMGLLYGQGDLDKTIIISTRCGHDSDCNPSSAGGILAASLGFSNLPEKFVSAIDPGGKFSFTPYNLPTLIDVCGKLARQAIFRQGGHIECDADGEEVFVIPLQKPKPSRLERSWQPGLIANSRYSEGEMRLITVAPGKNLSADIEKFAPGWKASQCGWDMNPGLWEQWNGRKNVLITHPLDQETGCVLTRKAAVPENKTTLLKLTVGHHTDPVSDWTLIVRVNGKEIFTQAIDNNCSNNGWANIEIPLTDFAGQEIELELVNQPSGWSYEAAYWGEISIKSL
ncbi:MAG: ADP-ribosylglycohydrolase family protein [Sedimentisphaerales bacterium]|nr:ADP-ribosylglycohydrolase family protein [Sedimentisphaerales bacterium]